jgi:hypothetical protein
LPELRFTCSASPLDVSRTECLGRLWDQPQGWRPIPIGLSTRVASRCLQVSSGSDRSPILDFPSSAPTVGPQCQFLCVAEVFLRPRTGRTRKVRSISIAQPTTAKLIDCAAWLRATNPQAAVFSAVDRILLCFLRSRIVEVFASPLGNAQIGLFDVAQHLLVERVLKRLEARCYRVSVGVSALRSSITFGSDLSPSSNSHRVQSAPNASPGVRTAKHKLTDGRRTTDHRPLSTDHGERVAAAHDTKSERQCSKDLQS